MSPLSFRALSACPLAPCPLAMWKPPSSPPTPCFPPWFIRPHYKLTSLIDTLERI